MGIALHRNRFRPLQLPPNLAQVQAAQRHGDTRRRQSAMREIAADLAVPARRHNLAQNQRGDSESGRNVLYPLRVSVNRFEKFHRLFSPSVRI
jgi:hypothetical protein